VAVIFGIMVMNGISVAPVQYSDVNSAVVATESAAERSESFSTIDERQASSMMENESIASATPQAAVESAEMAPALKQATSVADGLEIAQAPQMPLMNAAGTLAASIQWTDESSQFVVVTDQSGETIFTSNKIWPNDVKVNLMSWEDSQLTYEVVLSDGKSNTLVIDTATATEIEVNKQ
jgi:hypothetical protein